MSTQITTQKILAFDNYAAFGSLIGIEGYIYIDKELSEVYLWDSDTSTFVLIGADTPLPPDPPISTFVDAATIGALSFLPNYYNGPLNDGVGATLTATQVGVLRDTSGTGKIDSSYVPVIGGLILVKNQTLQYQNGIYVITTVGSPNPGGTLYQLTRYADFNQASELFPLQVNVLQGTVNVNQYFNQSTPSPLTIGISNLVFSPANYATAAGPIAFVDVATTTALPTCVYATGTTNASYPGLNATLTADAAGSVLTVDGLSASVSVVPLGTFTRVLVKNQANKAHNGDYIVVNPGSATVKWQLRRINYGASGFYRFTRYFLVSNTQASLAGKIYITKQQNPALSNLGIGTQNIDLVEYGGSALVVGTTPITSGTVGRIIFQGSGNVLQQDSSLSWSDVNKRLTLKAIGTTATDIPFVIQNSTGSANLMQVAGDNTITFLPLSNIGFSSSDLGGNIKIKRNFASQTMVELGGGDNAFIKITPINVSSYIGFGDFTANHSMFWDGTNYHFQNKNTFHNVFDVVCNANSATSTFRIGTIASNTNFFNVHGRNSGGTGLTTNPIFTINSSGTVGIGTEGSTPQARLDVRAQGALSTDIAFRVRNSVDTIDLFSINGNGVIYKPHNSPNDDNPIEIFNSQMSGGQNKISLFTKGSSNFSAGIGISFQSDAAGTKKSTYSLSGAKLASLSSFEDVSSRSVFHVGGSDVTEVSFLRLKNYSNTNQNIYIPRSGTIVFNPDNNGGLVRGLTLFGATLGATADRVIAIGSGTAPTTSTADNFQMYSNDIVAGNAVPHFRTENGDVIKLYKQTLPAVPVLTDVIALLTNLGLI